MKIGHSLLGLLLVATSCSGLQGGDEYSWEVVSSGHVVASGSCRAVDLDAPTKPWRSAVLVGEGTVSIRARGGVLLEKYEYLNGQLEGEHVAWQPRGQMRANCSYRKGILDGVSILWHENGRLMSIATYRNGQLEGRYREWFPNGQKRISSEYGAGRRNGRSRQWDEKGRLEEDAEWEDGKPWNGRVIEERRVGVPPTIINYTNGVGVLRSQ